MARRPPLFERPSDGKYGSRKRSGMALPKPLPLFLGLIAVIFRLPPLCAVASSQLMPFFGSLQPVWASADDGEIISLPSPAPLSCGPAKVEFGSREWPSKSVPQTRANAHVIERIRRLRER